MHTINTVLNELVRLVQHTLNEELIGIYLYGSAVHGDFDEELSDIDLLIVTKCTIDELNFDQLSQVHTQFDTHFPEWSNRIDLAYVCRESLRSFQSTPYDALTISGVHKLAKTRSEPHWLIDWYKVLHQSKVLFGPEPNTIIPDITKQEFQNTIRDYLLGWPKKVKSKTNPADLASIVLATCRSVYAYTTLENVSKRKGAMWAENEFPQYADLIRIALLLSRKPGNVVEQNPIDSNEALRFVEHMCARVR